MKISLDNYIFLFLYSPINILLFISNQLVLIIYLTFNQKKTQEIISCVFLFLSYMVT
jgi:hypothetical protein